MSEPDDEVFLYDGLCGLCDGAVQFIIARDKRRTLKFAPLQGSYASGVLQRHPEARGIDSLIFVRTRNDVAQDISNDASSDALRARETVLMRSDATIAIGHYLGGIWSVVSTLTRLIPRVVRDWAYDRVAHVRFRIFGRLEACRIPSTEERARFLE